MTFSDLVDPNSKVQQIASGMQFTEGPAWVPWHEGFLIFSDTPGDEIKKWTARDGVGSFLKPGKNPNGHTIDPQGNLVGCECGTRRVVRFKNGGGYDVIVDRFEGKKFNSPNDVVVKSDGTVWFTDPDYNVPKGESRELDQKYVFRFDPKSNELVAMRSDFDMPNGLCFSPDEKKLYIADSGKPHHIRAFDVSAENELSGGEVFCVIEKGVPDGIRCDEFGNVWSSAGDGIHIFSTDGKLIGKIPVEQTPSNLCFGGSDGRTVFITARTGVYRVDVKVKGTR